jgi:hypothetical protein
MTSFAEVKVTIRNFHIAGPQLLLPLWAVHVGKFLVALDWSRDLNTTGAPFEARRLAREDNQVDVQVSTS